MQLPTNAFEQRNTTNQITTTTNTGKGHAGHKICMLCINACNHKPPFNGTPLSEKFPGAFVPTTASTLDSFQRHTDNSMRHLIQKLNAARANIELTPEVFQNIQNMYGFVWTPRSIVLHEHMRIDVVSAMMFDYAHTYFCDGLADDELGKVMKCVHKAKTKSTWQELGKYVKAWTWPRRFGSGQTAIHNRLFNAKSIKKYLAAGDFSCSASEFVTLAPVLLQYFKRVVAPRGECMEQVRSMIAVLEVVELLASVPFYGVSPALLKARIEGHFKLFVEAYGYDCVRPKHHYALHLPEMLRIHGYLQSCIVHERKHRVTKRFTRDRKNLTSWNIGSVEEVTCYALYETSTPFAVTGSSRRCKPSIHALSVLRELFSDADPASIFTSTESIASDGVVRQHDLVRYEKGPSSFGYGELMVNATVTNVEYAIVCEWDRDASSDPSIMNLVIDVDPALTVIDAHTVLGACAFCRIDNRASVHLPLHVRE